MKKKGKIDNTSIQRLGLDAQIEEDPHHEHEHTGELEAVKKRQEKELKQLMDLLHNAEQERLKQIGLCKDAEEKKKLESENENEKNLSLEKVKKMRLNHEQEIKALQ